MPGSMPSPSAVRSASSAASSAPASPSAVATAASIPGASAAIWSERGLRGRPLTQQRVALLEQLEPPFLQPVRPLLQMVDLVDDRLRVARRRAWRSQGVVQRFGPRLDGCQFLFDRRLGLGEGVELHVEFQDLFLEPRGAAR